MDADEGCSRIFLQAGTIINRHMRNFKSWATTITWKFIIESVINSPAVLLPDCSFIVPVSP